jgi:uncharacterized protein
MGRAGAVSTLRRLWQVLVAVATLLPGVAWAAPPGAAVGTAGATDAPHHADYRFADGTVAFVQRDGELLFYSEGDRFVALQPKGVGAYVSGRGQTVSVSDQRLRIVADGSTREAARVRPYREQEARFHNGAVTLAGSVLLPTGPGPHPGVVVVHGAGHQDREGYRSLADRFARHGIAALIYDKRGSGRSTGRYLDFPTDYAALAADALAGVAFLRRLPMIDPAQVGVWGHSEGDWVAPLAAARSPKVAFVVAVAASGVSPARNVLYEIDNALRHAGVPDGAVEVQLRAATVAYRTVRAAGLVPGGDAGFELDPTRVWRRVRQPVLLLYGDRDRAVPPHASAAILAGALEAAGNQVYSVRVFPGANHAMVLAEDGFTTFADYHRGVDYPAGYLDTMTAWMRQPAADAVVPADQGRPSGRVERLRSVDGRPWHESLAVQLWLLALFLTVFLARSLAGLARWLRRRRRHRPAIQPPGVRRARMLAAWLSPLALLLLLAAAVVMVGYPSEPLVLVRKARMMPSDGQTPPRSRPAPHPARSPTPPAGSGQRHGRGQALRRLVASGRSPRTCSSPTPSATARSSSTASRSANARPRLPGRVAQPLSARPDWWRGRRPGPRPRPGGRRGAGRACGGRRRARPGRPGGPAARDRRVARWLLDRLGAVGACHAASHSGRAIRRSVDEQRPAHVEPR